MTGLERLWRSVFQAIAFVVFCVGGWTLATVFFPLLWLVPAAPDKKRAFVQKTVHYAFRLFLWFLQTFKAMDFTLEGGNVLRGNAAGVVIANHPTLLDVVLLIAHMPQADCIVKKELWNHFFLKGIVTSCGYIPNDDGPGLVDAAIARVREGRKVILFPEGTRSRPDGLQPFNKGFAHIAVKAPCLLWPVILRCAPPALAKGHGLFEVPRTRAKLAAVVQPPLDSADFVQPGDAAPVAVHKVATAVRHYFEEKIGDVPRT